MHLSGSGWVPPADHLLVAIRVPSVVDSSDLRNTAHGQGTISRKRLFLLYQDRLFAHCAGFVREDGRLHHEAI